MATAFDRPRQGNEKIPTLPAIVGRLIALYSSDNYGVTEVARVLERDPSISTRLLRLANSPYFSYTGGIRSVGSCVMILGQATVQGLALGSSLLAPWLNSVAPQAVRSVWVHSWLTASGARYLASRGACGPGADPEAIFMAALLHDIGKILLLRDKPLEYAKLLEEHAEDRGLMEAEAALFAQNHATVGFAALFGWKFPETSSALAGARSAAEVRPDLRPAWLVFDAAHRAACGLPQTGETAALGAELLEELSGHVESGRDAAEEFYRAIIQKWA